MYNQINEDSARRAKEANSFSDYRQGSATVEYRAMVDEAKEIAEKQKQIVDPMYHDKIDKLLARYSAKLAANFNSRNEIDARVPSIMIAGGSNFPTRKKEKQNAARDRNWKEYEDIKEILYKIRGVGMGGISADDPNAIDKLKEQLEDAEERQSFMKNANAYWRKHGTMKGYPNMPDEEAAKIDEQMKTAYSWIQKNGPFGDYKLKNNNANMRRIKNRIAELEKHTQSTFDGWEFEGGKVVVNKEINRLQIFFDEKPNDDLRAELKRNALKWAPSQGAWQRQFTDNALYAIKRIKSISPTSSNGGST